MEIETKPFDKFAKDWGLVTAGNKDHFNSMTIAWGGMGTLWRKPVITIYVRPERYTHYFLKENEYFTVSFFKEEYRESLTYMGTHSGRDENKAVNAKLTPVEMDYGCMAYKEANEVYICKKIYTQDMKKEDFPKDCLFFYGENGKPHTMFIGEVIERITR